MRLIYIIGRPGSGKSALLTSFVQDCGPAQLWSCGLARGMQWPQRDLYVIGIYDGQPFPGTDRLSMTAQRDVLHWLTDLSRSQPGATVLGEGDRLANRLVFETASALGDLTLVALHATEATLTARCTLRGSRQNASWLAGRKTKFERLVADFACLSWFSETAGDFCANRAALQALVE